MSHDDNDDNKAGPSSEKRIRHESLINEIQIPEYLIEIEEPPIEWEFSTPKPSWLDKIAREHQSLISTMTSNDDTKIRYESSLNPISWKIIDLFDQKIANLLSKNELSELNTTISASLKNWTILDPMAERYLYSLTKLDYDQLCIIGEIVRPNTRYEELESILTISRMMLQVKKLLSTTATASCLKV